VAVLMTPTLKDLEVLIVRGAQAMISIKGYAQEARLDKVLELDYDRYSIAMSVWPRRTMLFIDALELDMYNRAEAVPDLFPSNVEREIRKSYTAFSSRSSKNEQHTEIFTGLWGCGTFGGDWQIKAII
jgi:poly(ADP-ribose) glycohydrolase